MVSCICFAVCVCVFYSVQQAIRLAKCTCVFFLHGTCIYSCDELQINGCVHVAPLKHDEFMYRCKKYEWIQVRVNACMLSLAFLFFPSFSFLPLPSSSFLPTLFPTFILSWLACVLSLLRAASTSAAYPVLMAFWNALFLQVRKGCLTFSESIWSLGLGSLHSVCQFQSGLPVSLCFYSSDSTTWYILISKPLGPFGKPTSIANYQILIWY